MKIAILSLFLFVSYNSASQIDMLRGNWISSENEMISITDTISSNNYLTSKSLRNDRFYLSLKNDTISFQSRYYVHPDMNKLHVVGYNLRVNNLNDSILIVQPISKASKKFFGTSKSIQFIKQQYIKDENFVLNKLVFHTSSCYGTCPIIDMEITDDKKIKLKIMRYQENSIFYADEKLSGNFIGILDKETYDELVELLIESKVKDLNIKPQILCCDGAVKTLIIYHNDKRKYIISMFPPRILSELIEFLYKLDQKVVLERTQENFEFEK